MQIRSWSCIDDPPALDVGIDASIMCLQSPLRPCLPARCSAAEERQAWPACSAASSVRVPSMMRPARPSELQTCRTATPSSVPSVETGGPGGGAGNGAGGNGSGGFGDSDSAGEGDDDERLLSLEQVRRRMLWRIHPARCRSQQDGSVAAPRCGSRCRSSRQLLCVWMYVPNCACQQPQESIDFHAATGGAHCGGAGREAAKGVHRGSNCRRSAPGGAAAVPEAAGERSY